MRTNLAEEEGFVRPQPTDYTQLMKVTTLAALTRKRATVNPPCIFPLRTNFTLSSVRR
jgi:hypothetical protein